MTHYLRDSLGETIVCIEALSDDIHCVVDIHMFSEHLLVMALIEETMKEARGWIQDMDAIQEIRGEYFETVDNKETPDQLAERRCEEMAEKWELAYVTD